MRRHWRTSGRLWLSASLGAAFVFAAGLCAAQEAGTAHTAYDTVQASGDKVEWNEVRKLTLRPPDRLRPEAEQSNGARSLVVFDGKETAKKPPPAAVAVPVPQPSPFPYMQSSGASGPVYVESAPPPGS